MEIGDPEGDLATLKEVLCRVLDQKSIDGDQDIYEAGLTSIMVLPFLVEIEDAFGLTLPESDFLDRRTLRGLAQLIQQLRLSGSSRCSGR